MLNTLSIIGKEINKTNISWGVGGSLLLSFYQLIDRPNDIDILVDEQNAEQLNELLSNIARANEVIHYAPYKTVYFSKYSIDNINIDVMGGFAIEHDEGIYKLPFNKESVVAHKKINGVEIPLCSLEDWYILYWLIPGRQEKAILIENYFRNIGVSHPELLWEALNQPLPITVKERVENLLNYIS
ncbi:nucleotidyltransferase domain-containing protein [Ornithinibacillus bavariensis]|uniref:Uncharacterized protein n=1 Tax=Ornithinibacillus bavariensis TaxID=545502 RepID=A0A919X5X1_9BACI|nr:hypothetical protein [Ornithinibacillus bavariensis]GIO26329.1 hypothetical protein J43TS3_09400 [Ornithinibacillus bavariensis]